MIEEELFEKNYSRIKSVLEYANTTPYYHKLFLEAGLDFNNKISYYDFSKIAKTGKDTYEKNKYGMITSNLSKYNYSELNKLDKVYKRREYFKQCGIKSKTTSGSTGQPLEVLKSVKDDFRDYVNLNYYRSKITNYDFSGQFVQIWPVNRAIFLMLFPKGEHLRYERLNKKGYRYYLCEHSIDNLMDLYSFIINNRCEWITSSPTVLYKLSRLIVEENLEIPRIKYIECHSEKLFDWQREMIKNVFRCDVTSIYSSNEIQFIGGECKNKTMHLFEKNCFMEIVPDENGNNEIVVTSLSYFDIPMIRYRIGDCGRWNEKRGCCCELNNLHTFEIYGFRKNDYIKTLRGDVEPFVISDSIYNLSYNYGIEIKEYKVVQIDFNKFIYYISKSIINSENRGVIKRSLEDFLKIGLECEDIEVEFGIFDIDQSTHYSKKFKYFESTL